MGEAENCPPSRCFHTGLPVSADTQLRMPSSLTNSSRSSTTRGDDTNGTPLEIFHAGVTAPPSVRSSQRNASSDAWW